jgi:leader peptidase (prepilin peptidase)/N-methyltransferase
MEFIAVICAVFALLFLVWMGWIDLKLWILPNELVFALGLLALPFHIAIDWAHGGVLFFIMGAVIGGGALWLIRYISGKIYGFETLGLGDVKLMIAVGLWLGPENVLMAMSLGALCGVAHAGVLAYKNKISLSRMMLPAGPGFIAGTIIIVLWTYKDLLI